MNSIMRRCTLYCGVGWCLFFFSVHDIHSETIDDLFTICVVLSGATSSLDIVQTGVFPLCPQFLIFVVGKGSLGISLKNEESLSKETMFMLGLASSSMGTSPIGRLGVSPGMISQIVEVGSETFPYGLVWLYCGVLQADKNPVYFYELRLSFMP